MNTFPQPQNSASSRRRYFGNGRHRSDGLMKGTLCCRLCNRPAGDLVGEVEQSIALARFIPVPNAVPPRLVNGTMRCGRCDGRLQLDDVEPLLRTVPLSEVGGRSLGHVLGALPSQERDLVA